MTTPTSGDTWKAAKRYALSRAAFEEARRVLPGGVNSPVRAYKAVGRDPIFIQQGKGAIVTDLDGREYVDYVGSYGPLILGHADDGVLAAISKAARKGTSFGMPTERETTLAEMVIEAVPSVEIVRFVNSGTEACMSAIRLARAATGRNKVIKCTGCYHGHVDALLVQAGSGASTLGTPSSPGVPESITSQTVLVPFNDLEAVRRAFDEHAGDIACMAVEPIAGNMGCIPPEPGYLEGLREICDQRDALLLFDEVMTGFRVSYGGAQALYGVTPDLTCMGKVIGGGLPCAAYGGKAELMKQIAPDGPCYQAGTLSGNPLAMAAGIATLQALGDPELYKQLDARATELIVGLYELAQSKGVPLACTHVGSMVCAFFREQAPVNYEQATECDTQAFARFFRSMLDQGVTLPPSQFETWFVSTAHGEEHIEFTLEAASQAFEKVGRSAVSKATD